MSRDLKTLSNWAHKMADTTKPIRVPAMGEIWNPIELCGAYPSESERDLWRQIANEIDAFLRDQEECPTEIAGQGDLFITPPT